MDNTQTEQIIERISARFGQGGRMATSRDEYLQNALQCMVDAGACRIGMRVGQPPATGFSACDLAPPMARIIDHTALKPETTEADIRVLCDEAKRYCFASVCVNPCYVPLAAELLAGTPIAVCTVIGFPLGANDTATKAGEAERAVRAGATEVDMVLNIGLHKSGRYERVEKDIRAVVEAARASRRGGAGTERALVKVILETALLTDEEKVIACVLSQNAGADFVKTSTGFSKAGATASDVVLMRRVVGDKMGVKASGGVRSLEDAEKMVAHGATRIGASASVAIVKGLQGADGY
ncbi:MAG TPA: deoxyribose-phosphate aldolase [Rhodothermales bacterium]|nr:deoxyribose-phosphate aldolase [Rhodothermales bacterium]